MKCSVVILNWNGADMLRRYLPSVVANTPTSDCEVVVADNGSTDNSLSILAQEFPTIRTIILDRNYGFAEGYNRAIAQVYAEYVVLLNSDVEVTEGWLSPILSYMDEHQEVAAAQPKILSDRNRLLFEHAGAAGGYMDALGYPYCRGRILGHVEQDNHQYDTIADIFWATGACLITRTRLYNEVGGLDADFFAHMEEIDLCWRLNCRGYRLVCIPESQVYHLGGGALNYEHPRKTYLNFRNNLLMIYKNAPTAHCIGMLLARFVLDYVAALQLLISGKPRNAYSVVQARFDFLRMLSKYRTRRKENSEQAKIAYPPVIAHRSIIFDYYVRGIKTWRR